MKDDDKTSASVPITGLAGVDGSAMKRPEWITCIRHTHADKAGHTWCGRNVDVFTFLDIDHAAYNACAGGRLIACPECVAAVMDSFSPNK